MTLWILWPYKLECKLLNMRETRAMGNIWEYFAVTLVISSANLFVSAIFYQFFKLWKWQLSVTSDFLMLREARNLQGVVNCDIQRSKENTMVNYASNAFVPSFKIAWTKKRCPQFDWANSLDYVYTNTHTYVQSMLFYT